jgi:osmotically-inducible protein OsmY
MRRAPVRGWWAPPVAAGLTLIVLASAQQPGPAPRPAPGQPASAQPAQGAPVDDEAARLAEIKAELGWLADPLTFPYHLAAHVQSQTLGSRAGSGVPSQKAVEGRVLEIRGFVPNEAVRARAVKDAQAHTGLTVLDHLKIHPVTPRIAVVPPEELHKVALGALKSTFPRQAQDINVLCRSYGQVILTGRVASMEEKLAISQQLRGLAGCTSVLNQLAVGFVTTETAQGSSPAPARMSPSAPEKVVAVPAGTGPSVAQNELPLPAPPVPVPAQKEGVVPARMTTTAVPKEGEPWTSFGVVIQPVAVTRAQPQAPAAGPVLPDRLASRTPTSAGAPPGSPYAAAQGSPVPPSGTQPTAPGSAAGPNLPSPYAPASTMKTVPPSPRPVLPAPIPRPVWTPALTVAATAGVIGTGKATAVARASAPRTPLMTTGRQERTPSPVRSAATSASMPAAGQVVQTSFRPEGVPQTRTPPPSGAVAPRLGTPSPGEPYVTSGVLILGDVVSRSAPTPAVADQWAWRKALLKHAIQSSCGPALKDLEVELRSPKEAQIRFRAANKAEADRFWGEIQRIPELLPYKLDVVVKTP